MLKIIFLSRAWGFSRAACWETRHGNMCGSTHPLKLASTSLTFECYTWTIAPTSLRLKSITFWLCACMGVKAAGQRLKDSCGHVMDGCVDTLILSSSHQTLLWEFHMILFSYSPKIEKKTFWFYAWRSTSMVLIKLSHGHVMYTCMNLLILSSSHQTLV